MSIESHVSYVLVVAMFLTQAIMFWLQFTASRRHRQRSFVLLWIGTLCGVMYLLLNVMPIATPIAADIETPIFYVSSLLVVVQMVLSIWGTAELFQAYRKLDAHAQINAGLNS